MTSDIFTQHVPSPFIKIHSPLVVLFKVSTLSVGLSAVKYYTKMSTSISKVLLIVHIQPGLHIEYKTVHEKKKLYSIL